VLHQLLFSAYINVFITTKIYLFSESVNLKYIYQAMIQEITGVFEKSEKLLIILNFQLENYFGLLEFIINIFI